MDIAAIDIILSMQRTTKVLIRLHGCAGLSAPLLFTYGINRFSHDVAQIRQCLHKIQAQTHLLVDTRKPTEKNKRKIIYQNTPKMTVLMIISHFPLSFCFILSQKQVLPGCEKQHYVLLYLINIQQQFRILIGLEHVTCRATYCNVTL